MRVGPKAGAVGIWGGCRSGALAEVELTKPSLIREEMGQCSSLRAKKGTRPCVETEGPGRVYMERENSGFSFRTPEFLSIKLLKRPVSL